MKLIRRRRCRAPFRRDVGSGSVTDFCCRERRHDGPHASAWGKIAWVDVNVSKQVTYRYPYDNLRDDSTLKVEGVGDPEIGMTAAAARRLAPWFGVDLESPCSGANDAPPERPIGAE